MQENEEDDVNSIDTDDLDWDFEAQEIESENPVIEENIEPNTEPNAEGQQKTQEDEEREAYSKRVQKRIDKLTYERNIERDEREKLRKRLEAQEAELKAIRERQDKHFSDTNAATLEQQRRELLNKRRDYLELGDHDEVNNIDDQLMDIKLELRNSKALPKETPKESQKQDIAPEQQENQQQPVTQQESPYVPDAMSEWLGRNKWTADPKQRSKLAKADKIYQELVNKGYDPEEDDLYQEIDKRLKREVPPPGNGPDRGNVRGDETSTFTKRDRIRMEGFGLDPDDPKARAEWIKQKQKIA